LLIPLIGISQRCALGSQRGRCKRRTDQRFMQSQIRSINIGRRKPRRLFGANLTQIDQCSSLS
jgi:hypothetical protein